MASRGNIRTSGYGFLSVEQKQKMQQALRANKVSLRLAGRDADEEITLLKISATGIIPAAIQAILKAFGVGIGA